MSIFSQLSSNLLSWGIKTARDEGQAVAIRAINDALGQLQRTATVYAPDVAPAIAPQVQSIVATLVAGALTRK